MTHLSRELISVIIPVYNGESFIGDAIDSVFDQNYPNLELIVVDDGSTDDTCLTVKEYGKSVKYYYKTNGGPASARNLGLEKATGNLIAFIDADDLWMKDKLNMQINILNAKPRTEIVIGLTQRIPISIAPNKAMQQKVPDVQLVYHLGASLIRREVFYKIGVLDESMKLSEDTDWFFRASEAGIEIDLHPNIVQFYRFHQKNITNNKEQAQFYQIMAYKKSMDRRRSKNMGGITTLPKPNNLDDIESFWNEKGLKKRGEP